MKEGEHFKSLGVHERQHGFVFQRHAVQLLLRICKRKFFVFNHEGNMFRLKRYYQAIT